MRKTIYMAGLILGLFASSCAYDDGPIKNRIDSLDEQIKRLEALALELNEDISDVYDFFLSAENGDMIKSCELLEDGSGYRIVFAEAGEIIIANGKDAYDESWKDGEDGVVPVVGVAKEDDGRVYWTLDGEPLVDEDGNRIYLTANAAAGEDGNVPQLRVKDGMWQVSYNGIRWDDLGQSSITVPQGGMYWFTKVEENADYYTFTLRSSQEVKVAKLQTLNLTISGYEDIEVLQNITTSADYQVRGATQKTKVYAVSNCAVRVSVEPEDGDMSKGKIVFHALAERVDGSVLVYADNGYGSTSMRMITFVGGRPDVTDIEGYDPLEDFDWYKAKQEEGSDEN